MGTREKIQVDRVIGRPIAIALNALARLAGWALRRDHSVESESVRVIAVAKFVGMGSIIQAAPLLRALRARYPHARLIFVTGISNRPLLERLRDVDEAIYVDDQGPVALLRTSLSTLIWLARQRVDLYFDLEVYSAYACLLALLSLARNRYGYYRTSTRFKLGIYTHLVYFNTARPIRHLYLQLGLAAETSTEASDELPRLELGKGDREGFRARWKELLGTAPDDPYLVVNPNASDLMIERRWPTKRFVETIEQLVARGYRIALTGQEHEAEFVAGLVADLAADVSDRVVDTAGRLGFGEFLALLDGARCVITNDTGPMHMAIALDRPTVCLFGPGDPGHYGVVKPRVEILYRSVFCSPCLYHTDDPPCAGDNVCMKKIRCDEVLDAVDRVLTEEDAGAREARPATSMRTLLRSGTGVPLGMIVRESIPGAATLPCPGCGESGSRTLFRRDALHFVACVRCGLQRIDPPPSDETLAGIYGRTYYDAWGLQADEQIVSEMKRATFQRLLDALDLAPGARILDCGAATGFFMQAAAEQGFIPFGVELSPFGCEQIAEHFGSERVFCGQLEQARFQSMKGEPFAALFMLDFIEHLRSPEATLRAAHQLLHPGGLLLLTTPDTESLTRRLMGRHWTHYKTEHLIYFSRSNLQRLLERAGFELLEVRPATKRLTLRYAHHQFSTYPHWLFSPVLRLLHAILPANLLDRLIPVVIGEMQVTARRRPSDPTDRSADSLC